MNRENIRGLVVKIGKMFAPDAYIADDGSFQDEILCAKVPDVVRNLCTSYGELIFAVERKFLGETRHQTALRYIRGAEQSPGDQGQQQAQTKKV